MIVDRINEYLSGSGKAIDEGILLDVGSLMSWSFRRQFGEQEVRTGEIRLSSIGRCLRQQAYKALGFEENGKKIDARSKMVFFQGDAAENAIVHLAKQAGCMISSSGQTQIEVDVDGIKGHPDGLLKDPSGTYLLEVKSMSSYGFAEFQRGMLDEGYRYQINAYMYALKLTQAVVVALNKDAGVLAEMVISLDPEIALEIQRRIRVLKAVTEKTLPDRPYHPNEKGMYPWNCLYCAFHETCLPHAEKVIVGKSYKLKEMSHATTVKG